MSACLILMDFSEGFYTGQYFFFNHFLLLDVGLFIQYIEIEGLMALAA